MLCKLAAAVGPACAALLFLSHKAVPKRHGWLRGPFSKTPSMQPLFTAASFQLLPHFLFSLKCSLDSGPYAFLHTSATKKAECNAEHGDCFVSIISSHGTEGSIFDCEGQPVQLTRIFNILSPRRSHNLVGKPKIFFIQACRGTSIEYGVDLQMDSPGLETGGTEPQTDCFSHYLSIPDNTAVMFSCSPGYVSFINLWESMFLRAFLDLLEGEEHHFEVARLMTRISWKVAFFCEAKGKYRGAKEMPCFVMNMERPVYPFSSQG